MLRFEYDTNDIELDQGDNYKVEMEWEGDEGDIQEIVDRFRYFLLALSYPNSLVDRIYYLNDSQIAKLKLLDEGEHE